VRGRTGEGDYWGCISESLARASGTSLGAGGVGIVVLRRGSWCDEAAGRMKGGARRRTELCDECRIFGLKSTFSMSINYTWLCS
jgi:hypothetical protein